MNNYISILYIISYVTYIYRNDFILRIVNERFTILFYCVKMGALKKWHINF